MEIQYGLADQKIPFIPMVIESPVVAFIPMVIEHPVVAWPRALSGSSSS